MISALARTPPRPLVCVRSVVGPVGPSGLSAVLAFRASPHQSVWPRGRQGSPWCSQVGRACCLILLVSSVTWL
jgi:hypothetical protein